MSIENELNTRGLTDVEEVCSGFRTRVIKAVRLGKDVAIKIFAASSSYHSEVESAGLLPSCGVKTPIMVDTFGLGNDNAIVYEWWDSVTLENALDNLSVAQIKECIDAAGSLLGTITNSLDTNEIKQCSFWHQPGFMSWDQYSWHDYLMSLITKWRSRIIFTLQDIAVGLPDILANTASIFDFLCEPPNICLIHCDYGYRNLLVEQASYELLGVIDFELALIGDPLYDVANLTWRIDDKNDLKSVFLDAWQISTGQSVNEQRLLVYEAIKAISAIAWVDKQPDNTFLHKAFRAKAVDHLMTIGSLLTRSTL